MFVLLVKILLLAVASGTVQTATIDDVACERQLNFFDDALAEREQWALLGKETWTEFQYK